MQTTNDEVFLKAAAQSGVFCTPPQAAITESTDIILGSDYLAFLSDASFWPTADHENVYAEDVVLVVDGKRYEQHDLMPDTITMNSSVAIVKGDVFEFMTPLHSLRQHFESWRETYFTVMEKPSPKA